MTLLEQEPRTGGLAASMKSEEFAADLGPHRIYTELPEIERLLPELIQRDQMLTVQRRSQLLLEGHFYDYPVRATELLKQLGPVRMAKFGFSAISGKVRGAMSRPRNYEEAMSSAFGRAAYDLLVGPYTRKVWKIAPAQLSEEVARVRVSAGNTNKLIKQLLNKSSGKKGTQSALSSFTYIKGGVENLVKNLEAKVRAAGGIILLDRRVESLRRQGLRIVEVTDSNGEVHRADNVISTMPITALTDLLNEIEPSSAVTNAAKDLVFIGLILVGIIVERDQLTPNSWIYFPEEKYVFNRAYEPRNFDSSMAPTGRTMVVFEVTARWDDEIWTASDDALIERVKREAVSTGLMREDEISGAFAVRVPYTYPLYTTDFRAKLQVIFDYLVQFKNLVTTGRQGLFNHNNMDHSMLMGIRAAEYVAQGGKVAERWVADLEQFSHFRIVD